MSRIPNRSLSGRQLTRMVLGILLLIPGLMWVKLNVESVQLWIFADRYLDAELEVVKYHRTAEEGIGPPGDSRSRRSSGSRNRSNLIEGIIRPGETPIVSDDRRIQVTVFDGPSGMVGRLPLRDEVEGKRYPVLFWPELAGPQSWYHPPQVLSATRPTNREIALHLFICTVLLGGGVGLIRSALRTAITMSDREFRAITPGFWPPWTGITAVFFGFAWMLWGILFVALTSGRKVNANATAWIETTRGEWIYIISFLAVFGIIPLTFTYRLGSALRIRFKKRSG